MLGQFLRDAASAYAETEYDLAFQVAEFLGQIYVCDQWQTDGKRLHQAALKTALDAEDCHPSAVLLESIADHLTWYDSMSLRSRPTNFVGDYCFTAIVGPGGLIENEKFRFGVYLQEPHTIYPSHKHEAVELYLPISGTALWQKDDAPFAPIKPGTLIHHTSYQPHATTTDETPMLAFWAWLGNLSLETYSYVSQ